MGEAWRPGRRQRGWTSRGGGEEKTENVKRSECARDGVAATRAQRESMR